MEARNITLLHVEDDEMQRLFLARLLKSFKDWSFIIIYAESEDGAVEEFKKGEVEFVVLDFQLHQGNGLSCLRKLREIDPLVPIIAISGVATPEIAAELLQAGADDYITKENLTGEVLNQSIRPALARADACRSYPRAANMASIAKVEEILEQIGRIYVAGVGPAFVSHLDEFETVAREANLTMGQMQRVFENLSTKFETGSSSASRLLRPVLLEMLLRMFGERLGVDDKVEAVGDANRVK